MNPRRWCDGHRNHVCADLRGDRRDDRRDNRQGSRGAQKQACKAGDEKSRAECRHEKRETKHGDNPPFIPAESGRRANCRRGHLP